jgi:hypothetical protein
MILSFAALALAPVFTDGAVLQQGMDLPVWGTAAARAKVTVSFAGHAASAFADGAGRWIAYLPALDASGDPRDLLVRAAGPASGTAAAHRLTVGEVWIGAGAGDSEVADSFARHLQNRLGVPVAIVGAVSPALDAVLPEAARGVLWLGARPPAAADIREWREHFGAPDLPVYWAGTEPVSAAALRVAHTGQAVTLDRPDQPETGRRLALIAKAEVYGLSADFSGPLFAAARPEKAALRLYFRYAENGLIASGRPLQTFEIAGADRRYFPAVASVEGNTIVVQSPRVPHPMAVRSAWRNNPNANLFNGAGLPAAPFTWP